MLPWYSLQIYEDYIHKIFFSAYIIFIFFMALSRFVPVDDVLVRIFKSQNLEMLTTNN